MFEFDLSGGKNVLYYLEYYKTVTNDTNLQQKAIRKQRQVTSLQTITSAKKTHLDHWDPVHQFKIKPSL